MNQYLEPQGFLGTGASLFADLTLLAYIFLIVPGMLMGFYFARTKRFRPNHKWTMVTITTVNWILIIFLMFVAYRFDVAENIGPRTRNLRYLMPTIHAIFGLPAQLLATFLVIRMLWEDRVIKAAKARGEKDMSKYWLKNAKLLMRTTLTLWLITAGFGVLSYLIRYDVVKAANLLIPQSNVQSVPDVTEAPETTEEPAPVGTRSPQSFGLVNPPITRVPITTEEAPVATEAVEPIMTEEVPVMTEEAPVATEAVEPAMTEEAPAATEASG